MLMAQLLWCFVRCWSIFPISLRVISLELWKIHGSSLANKAQVKNMDRSNTWSHMNRKHDQNINQSINLCINHKTYYIHCLGGHQSINSTWYGTGLLQNILSASSELCSWGRKLPPVLRMNSLFTIDQYEWSLFSSTVKGDCLTATWTNPTLDARPPLSLVLCINNIYI